MARWYWYDHNGEQIVSLGHPPQSRPIAAAVEWMRPELISDLHRGFARWAEARLSTGPVLPHRLWIDQAGLVAVRFASGAPQRLPEVGAGEELAQWFVLLAKWMETYVVLARARTVWSTPHLAAALPFLSPCMLPRPLAQLPPDNWEEVACGLAATVLDSPVLGATVMDSSSALNAQPT